MLTSIRRSIRESLLDEQHRQIIQFLEMIARMSNLVRFVSQPPNRLENLIEVNLFLRFRIRIVESQITISTMIFSEAEIDGDSFRMPNLTTRNYSV